MVTTNPHGPVSRIWGVDFSGAKDAGRNIWIAKTSNHEDALWLDDVRPLTAIPLDAALAELRTLITHANGAVIGLDFPFGLPRALVSADQWGNFLAEFGSAYASADAFHDAMYLLSNAKDVRRATDDAAKTPWCPYNLRLYKQTFYGIRDVLAPLVGSTAVRAAPMQSPSPPRPTLIEICPRSTLKHFGKATASTPDILTWLGTKGFTIDEASRKRIVEDRRGDARDGVIAAFATWRAVMSGSVAQAHDFREVEGYVFV